MGFLSKLFGLKRKEEEKQPAATLAFYEKLIEQIAISAELIDELKAELKQAFEDPKSFYDDYNNYTLAERGLTYRRDVLLTPKFVLIDTLYANGQMGEVDWKEEESEIRTSVIEILMAKEYTVRLNDDDVYGDRSTDEILTLINEKELKPFGYSTVFLDINSDSYVFTIVPLSEKKIVEEMFAVLK